MFVLILSSGFPTADNLCGIFEWEQAKSLAKKGIRIAYAAIDFRSFRHKRKWGIQSLEKDGIPVYLFNVPCGNIPINIRTRIGRNCLLKIYQQLLPKQGKPDIVHAHFFEMGIIGSVLKEKYNIPMIVTEHSSKLNTPHPHPKDEQTAVASYKQADALIAVSSALAQNISRLSPHQPICIPNIVAIDFAFIPHLPHSEFHFVSTGNLIPGKRMELLISAFTKFHHYHPNTKLTIFGDGELRPLLEKQISANGLEDAVRLMGVCTHKQMAKIYETGDCFVLASASETFGVAYIEAMAAGLPVIATKCGGPEDFVNDTNGILIPVDDKDALVDAMEFMCSNQALYDRERISKEIIERFSPNAVAEKLLACYRQILPEHQEG